jgi:hypothetical protein
MAKTLDFNSIEPRVLELIMRDDERTRINVGVPTEALVEELQTLAPKLNALITDKDEANMADVYDLAARLINCNRSGVKVTVEELRGKYHMNLETLLIFFGAYMDFINEITNEKN